MHKPKCDLDCGYEMENTEDQNTCCYWCPAKSGCCNSCINLDCKAVKEMEVDEEN
jgi:hypothetical protein